MTRSFETNNFLNYLFRNGIGFKLIPHGRHSSAKLESKHGIIRSILLGLQDASEQEFNANIGWCPTAVYISNSLYGNDMK